MGSVLLVIHLLTAIFLVAVILMQRSSGGALNGLGGGSGANSFLTARGTGNLLTRLTAILATVFSLPVFHYACIIKEPSAKANLFWMQRPLPKTFRHLLLRQFLMFRRFRQQNRQLMKRKENIRHPEKQGAFFTFKILIFRLKKVK